MFFERDGIRFHYRTAGEGVPFIYQHGLGADVNQPFKLFDPPPPGIRLLSFDCRLHGQTVMPDAARDLSLATFADDLLGFMDFLGIQRAIVGGISMGAAVALNFALRFPSRVKGLVLHRPAWLDGPNLKNAEIFEFVAKLIREYEPAQAREQLLRSKLYAELRAESVDCAESLSLQCAAPHARETAARLERIPRDAPNHDRKEWRDLKIPVLVMANRQDPIHPFEYGEILAAEISGAEFHELTPKSVSVERYGTDVRRCLTDFVTRHFLAPAGAGSNA
jgi:pimeloyl-ACP methyl ester carboxylesterase